jgi:hypothetical protein
MAVVIPTYILFCGHFADQRSCLMLVGFWCIFSKPGGWRSCGTGGLRSVSSTHEKKDLWPGTSLLSTKIQLEKGFVQKAAIIFELRELVILLYSCLVFHRVQL